MGFTKEEIMECTVMVFDQPPFWPLNGYTDNSLQFTVIEQLTKHRSNVIADGEYLNKSSGISNNDEQLL